MTEAIRCAFDFHGECDRCVLTRGHEDMHRCIHDPDISEAQRNQP